MVRTAMVVVLFILISLKIGVWLKNGVWLSTMGIWDRMARKSPIYRVCPASSALGETVFE